MAQYKDGTVTLTNGSAVMTGLATLWQTGVNAPQSGDMVTITGDLATYNVGSVDSETQITLTGPYAGVTGGGKGYAIGRDYTNNINLPTMTSGDINTPLINKRQMEILDGLFGNLVYAGNMDQGVATTDIPEFSGMTLTGALAGTSASFTGEGTFGGKVVGTANSGTDDSIIGRNHFGNDVFKVNHVGGSPYLRMFTSGGVTETITLNGGTGAITAGAFSGATASFTGTGTFGGQLKATATTISNNSLSTKNNLGNTVFAIDHAASDPQIKVWDAAGTTQTITILGSVGEINHDGDLNTGGTGTFGDLVSASASGTNGSIYKGYNSLGLLVYDLDLATDSAYMRMYQSTALGAAQTIFLDARTGIIRADTLSISGGSILDISGAISFGNENLTTTGTMNVGPLNVSGPHVSTITSAAIVSGAITVTSGIMIVTPETGTTDDLITLNGVVAGEKFSISCENAGDIVTIKHNVGNIRTNSGADIVITNVKTAEAVFNGNSVFITITNG